MTVSGAKNRFARAPKGIKMKGSVTSHTLLRAEAMQYRRILSDALSAFVREPCPSIIEDHFAGREREGGPPGGLMPPSREPIDPHRQREQAEADETQTEEPHSYPNPSSVRWHVPSDF